MDDVSPLVVADVFEEGSGVPSSLQRLGARVVVEPLSAGDYRISGGALVERKTVADLHGSLGRGRLWSQIGRIRDEAAVPFLFVEGADIDDGPCHPNAIRGCLLAGRRSGSRDRPLEQSGRYCPLAPSTRRSPGTAAARNDSDLGSPIGAARPLDVAWRHGHLGRDRPRFTRAIRKHRAASRGGTG